MAQMAIWRLFFAQTGPDENGLHNGHSSQSEAWTVADGPQMASEGFRQLFRGRSRLRSLFTALLQWVGLYYSGVGLRTLKKATWLVIICGLI